MTYYEAKDRDPLGVLNGILHQINYTDRSEPEFFDCEGRTLGPDGDRTGISPIQYQLLLYRKNRRGRGRYFVLSGTILNAGGMWEGDGELENHHP